jgi:hypothetical protein
VTWKIAGLARRTGEIMDDTRKSLSPWIGPIWQKIKGRICQEVPGELAACEYDCDEMGCSTEDWKDCEKRKRHALPGESSAT